MRMIQLRPLRWPDDRESLRTLDVSFTTQRIYHIRVTERSFALEDTALPSAIHKAYDLDAELDRFPTYTYVVIAEVDAVLAGVATLAFESWNHRAILWHLLVDAGYRGCGVGRTLMDDIVRAAQAYHARCLWLETQNINYGAIQFYRRVGFQWCGLDQSLYDPDGLLEGETALFFVRQLP